MISVIIPLYNKKAYITATLQSVLRQSYPHFELVVVNDGSTDDSPQAVETMQDNRLRLIHQPNKGVSAARNQGIRVARNEYIALLDADDIWEPDCLQTLAQLADKYPDCDIFACNYEFKQQDGSVRPTIIRKLPFTEEDGVMSNYFEVAACSHPPICSSSVMIRKEALRSIGGFPEGLSSGEDLLTWARLACRYRIAYSRRVCARFVSTPSGSAISKVRQRRRGDDPVADELFTLQKQNPHVARGLKQYIHRWFRMRGIVALEADEPRVACSYALRGLMQGGKIREFAPLLALSLLPAGVSRFIFNLRKQ
ncbi:MAG: glycosyltransferase family 2 protein [Akkermansia sp.]|nr:glycosyltransferase family 2 protein [Akkermansia sp.]